MLKTSSGIACCLREYIFRMCCCVMPSRVYSQNAQLTFTGSYTIPFLILSYSSPSPLSSSLLSFVPLSSSSPLWLAKQSPITNKIRINQDWVQCFMRCHYPCWHRKEIRGNSLPVSESCSTSRVRNLAKRAVYVAWCDSMRFNYIRLYSVDDIVYFFRLGD